MQFSKWHALGNSYLVLEAPHLTPERVVLLCDFSIGIGADGVAQVAARSGAHADVVVWNPDGSTAEMSGNGTRIAACWLGLETGETEVTIVSAGREVRARIRDTSSVETEIGTVEVGATETIDVAGEPVALTPVSVGNPHAVIRSERPSRDVLLRLGPLVETHARFPDRTNVQFVRPRTLHDVEVLVWERGAGETTASGSSAVAAAVAAIARGWCQSPVTVHMPGGALVVVVDGSRTLLIGPAERVCVGDTDL